MPSEWTLYILRGLGILFSVACIGVIVEMQRRKLVRLKDANTYSSIVMLHKRHAGNKEYASYNRLIRIDGMRTETFLYRVGVPAVYLAPGDHVVEVEANWARHIRGQRMKNYTVGPRTMRVSVGSGQYWSLEYCIPRDTFIFEKCDPENVFKCS